MNYSFHDLTYTRHEYLTCFRHSSDTFRSRDAGYVLQGLVLNTCRAVVWEMELLQVLVPLLDEGSHHA